MFELKGVNELGCNCNDLESCHGNIIIKLYNELFHNENKKEAKWNLDIHSLKA